MAVCDKQETTISQPSLSSFPIQIYYIHGQLNNNIIFFTILAGQFCRLSLSFLCILSSSLYSTPINLFMYMYTIGQREQLPSQSDARQWKEHHIEPSGNKLNYTHALDYYWYLISLRMCKKLMSMFRDSCGILVTTTGIC